MISTTATKAPSYAGAFAVRGLDAWAARGVTAAERATGLPAGTAVRLRPAVDVPMTGLPTGVVQLNSTTPGDLPPRDPLS
ncbi:hypothetical protein [Klenkia terrae]|uniref:Uncharacterized protein n=2 Tax=Klenkia terrae TaxID=1052259 RepID=A0ABU8E6E8_9ACTN|nr:hypothetical protein [Klenkia terrae]